MKSAERSAECPVGKSRRSSKTDANPWLGRQDSNLRMAVPKTAALPLGYTPIAELSFYTDNIAFGNRCYLQVENRQMTPHRAIL